MIDSKSFERDAVGTPVSVFPHPALELDPKKSQTFWKRGCGKTKVVRA
jgi:hypothetical protein